MGITRSSPLLHMGIVGDCFADEYYVDELGQMMPRSMLPDSIKTMQNEESS